MYLERIPVDSIDTTSEETMNQFVYDMYQKKDDLMTYHNEKKKFPGEYEVIQPRLRVLINWFFWFIIITGGQVMFLYHNICNRNYVALMIYSSVLLICLAALGRMLKSTQASKGSSYGTSKQQKLKNGSNRQPPVDSSQTNGKTNTDAGDSNDLMSNTKLDNSMDQNDNNQKKDDWDFFYKISMQYKTGILS